MYSNNFALTTQQCEIRSHVANLLGQPKLETIFKIEHDADKIIGLFKVKAMPWIDLAARVPDVG